jgi:hypothetical protein
LTALSIPVYVGAAADTADDTYRELAEIGALTGHGAQAAAVAEQIKEDLAKILAEVPARAEPLTYFYELDNTSTPRRRRPLSARSSPPRAWSTSPTRATRTTRGRRSPKRSSSPPTRI